jgi:hypothetical protein
MKRRLRIVLIAMQVSLTMSAQQAAQPKYQQGTQPDQPSVSARSAQKRSSSAPQKSGRYSYTVQFTGADRDTIRTCMAGTYGNPGLTARPLPPALDKQIQLNTQLPRGLQNRVQPLPDLCDSRLVTLPLNWSRVLLGRHVLLLDDNQRVEDIFNLDQ